MPPSIGDQSALPLCEVMHDQQLARTREGAGFRGGAEDARREVSVLEEVRLGLGACRRSPIAPLVGSRVRAHEALIWDYLFLRRSGLTTP